MLTKFEESIIKCWTLQIMKPHIQYNLKHHVSCLQGFHLVNVDKVGLYRRTGRLWRMVFLWRFQAALRDAYWVKRSQYPASCIVMGDHYLRQTCAVYGAHSVINGSYINRHAPSKRCWILAGSPVTLLWERQSAADIFCMRVITLSQSSSWS